MGRISGGGVEVAIGYAGGECGAGPEGGGRKGLWGVPHRFV
jgi:hypothetical protein